MLLQRKKTKLMSMENKESVGAVNNKETSHTKAKEVINHFSEGILLKEALEKVGISATSFARALNTYKDLWLAYECAKEILSDVMASESLAISDNQEEDPNSRRVKIDIRKWIASKWNRKVYGDKVEMEVTGSVDLNVAIKEARARALTAGRVIENAAEPELLDVVVEPAEPEKISR